MKSKSAALAAVVTVVGILGTIVGLFADSLGIVDFFLDHFAEDWTPTQSESAPISDDAPNHYEYREKEFTESSEATLSGWWQYKHTDVPEYGQYSPWQYTPVVDNATTDVQTTTHYKWRTLTEETIVGEWSPWTTDRRQNIGSHVEERSENYPLYGYYYFECPNCGFHMHVYNTACASYAGGCGQLIPDDSGWHSIYLDLSWDDADLQDWYGTGHFYTIIDGERWFKWQYGDNMSTGTRYSYRETTTQSTPSSDWFYSSQQPDPSLGPVDCTTVTAYRWRPVYTTTTYYYWRWSQWRNCSEEQYHQYQNDEDNEVRIISD